MRAEKILSFSHKTMNSAEFDNRHIIRQTTSSIFQSLDVLYHRAL